MRIGPEIPPHLLQLANTASDDHNSISDIDQNAPEDLVRVSQFTWNLALNTRFRIVESRNRTMRQKMTMALHFPQIFSYSGPIYRS